MRQNVSPSGNDQVMTLIDKSLDPLMTLASVIDAISRTLSEIERDLGIIRKSQNHINRKLKRASKADCSPSCFPPERNKNVVGTLNGNTRVECKISDMPGTVKGFQSFKLKKAGTQNLPVQ